MLPTLSYIGDPPVRVHGTSYNLNVNANYICYPSPEISALGNVSIYIIAVKIVLLDAWEAICEDLILSLTSKPQQVRILAWIKFSLKNFSDLR